MKRTIITILLSILLLNAECMKLSAYFLPYTKMVNSTNGKKSEAFVILLRLTNDTDSNFSFWGMSCSLHYLLKQKSKPFVIFSLGCDRNKLQLYNLKPGESAEFVEGMVVTNRGKVTTLIQEILFCQIKENEFDKNDMFSIVSFTKLIQKKFKENKGIIKLELKFDLWDIYFG